MVLGVHFWSVHCNNSFPWHQALKLQSPLKIIIIFPSILTTSIRSLMPERKNKIMKEGPLYKKTLIIESNDTYKVFCKTEKWAKLIKICGLI